MSSSQCSSGCKLECVSITSSSSEPQNCFLCQSKCFHPASAVEVFSDEAITDGHLFVVHEKVGVGDHSEGGLPIPAVLQRLGPQLAVAVHKIVVYCFQLLQSVSLRQRLHALYCSNA